MPKRKRELETRECIICAEEKPVVRNSFPTFISCDHGANTCLDCYSQQTATVLGRDRTDGWSKITCLECDGVVTKEELQGVLPRRLVKELNNLSKQATYASDDAWRWCLAPGCGHGGIYDESKGVMIKCRKCGARSCFNHQVKWHEGYSCENYELSHPDSPITKTNEDLIKKTTKPCPCKSPKSNAGGGRITASYAQPSYMGDATLQCTSNLSWICVNKEQSARNAYKRKVAATT